MGGGDLNLKKSWHPHTLKNQERVWKAEQQKAEEDRKMAVLQQELKEERERELLRRTAEASGAVEKKGDAKLDWMYKGPGGHVSREEYLLGRKIDTAFQQLVNAEEEERDGESEEPVPQSQKPAYTIEHDINPESIIRRDPGNVQVDMRRKLVEDPLLLIRQREEETKRQITANPVKMKQLQQLISSIKSKKKKKKRDQSSSSDSSDSDSSSSDSDSSDSRKKKRKKKKKSVRKRSLSSDSSDSTDDSSDERMKRKKKKLKHKKDKKSKKIKKRDRKGKKKKTKREKFEESESNDDKERQSKAEIGHSIRQYIQEEREKHRGNKKPEKDWDASRNRELESGKDGGRSWRDFRGMEQSERKRENNWEERSERSRERDRERNRDSGKGRSDSYSRDKERDRVRNEENWRKNQNDRQEKRSWERKRSPSPAVHRGGKQKLTDEEMERKREEMMAAAKRRDEERKQNVQRYAEEKRKEEEMEKNVDKLMQGHLMNASKGSIEDRVKSRVSSLQRGLAHMESNFARK